MKKLMHLGFLVMISLTIVACGNNSDDDNNNNDDDTAQFVVDVDGVRKEIGFANCQYTNDGKLILVSGITGFGDPNGGFALGVSVGTIIPSSPVITVGTYNSADSDANIIFTPGGEEPFESNSTSATVEITITEIDTNAQTISGTFEGTVKRADETMVLTNGEFNEVSYN